MDEKKYKLSKLLFPCGLLCLLFIIIGVWVVDSSLNSMFLYQDYKELKIIEKKGWRNLSIESTKILLFDTNKHIKSLQRDLLPLYPFLDLYSNIPIIGKYVGQVKPLINFGYELTNSCATIIHMMDSHWQNPILKDFSTTQKISIILINSADDINKAKKAIDNADKARTQIDSNLLPTFFREDYQKLNDRFEYIQVLVSLLQVFPDIAGLNQAQKYVIIAQNRDELRATGGFITAIGTADVENSMFKSFNINDSYQIDNFNVTYPPAPEPMVLYMMAPFWVTRDANWSPDFATSARQVQELYYLSTNQITDGVIAIDQDAIRSLLKILGPIKINDYPTVIDETNVEEFMHYAWGPEEGEELNKDWWINRKNFIPQLGEEMLNSLLGITESQNFIELLTIIYTNIKEGHILLYFTNPQVQEILIKTDLDNSVKASNGDFLMLVDSNIGFNKVDAVIERSIEYDVDLSDPQYPIALVHINYKHLIQTNVTCVHEPMYGKTYADMWERCYWDYWRIIKPEGTGLMSSKKPEVRSEWLMSGQDTANDIMVYPEGNGVISFEGMMVLPTSQSQDIFLELSLPNSVIDMKNNQIKYNLHVQKQPGLEKLPIKIQIKLPDKYIMANQEQDWKTNSSPNIYIWDGLLYSSQEFELIFNNY